MFFWPRCTRDQPGAEESVLESQHVTCLLKAKNNRHYQTKFAQLTRVRASSIIRDDGVLNVETGYRHKPDGLSDSSGLGFFEDAFNNGFNLLTIGCPVGYGRLKPSIVAQPHLDPRLILIAVSETTFRRRKRHGFHIKGFQDLDQLSYYALRLWTWGPEDATAAIKIRLMDNPASRESILAVKTVIGQLLSTPRDVLERQDPKSLVNDGCASWTEPADRLVCYALFGLESNP